MAFKDRINDLASALDEAADEAGEGLHNQNLADVVRGVARNLRVSVLAHPDVERVGSEKPNEAAAGAPLNSGGNALFAATDPGSEAARTEAARRATWPGSGELGAKHADAPGYVDPATTLPAAAPFPAAEPAPAPFPGGAPVKDPSKLDPDANHPGDPKFQKPNADFKDPNAVNLNDDGTLKQAPNAFGASDERDGGKKE